MAIDINLIDYIKKNYPKVIFNPLKLKLNDTKTKALGFIINNNQLIIGYISKNGEICKLIEPIDLSLVSHIDFAELIKKIPVVQGFNETDRENLLNILLKKNVVSEIEHADIVSELKLKLSNSETKFNIYKSKNENSIILIKKEYDDKIQEITKKHAQFINDLEYAHDNCKNKILKEKEFIIDNIKVFKENILVYINNLRTNKNLDYKKLDELYTKLTSDKLEIETTMKNLTNKEKEYLDEIELQKSELSNYTLKIETKENEINNLQKSIKNIQEELNNVQDKFSKQELDKIISDNFKKECLDKIIQEKEVIINGIKDYTSKWMEWVSKNQYNIESQKEELKKNVDKIIITIKNVMKYKNDYISNLDLSNKEKDKMLSKLNTHATDIKDEVINTLNKQLIELHSNNDISSDKDNEIIKLKQELKEIKELLNKNENIPVPKVTDYKNCYSILQKFIIVNNMFYRKKEIMKLLDNILLGERISSFTNLNKQTQENIKQRYTKVVSEINKHILFLDLQKYLNSPIIDLFKSKDTIKNVPTEFCEELSDISRYWEANVLNYRQQDIELTNIYEDISGSVRVFVRIKPLLNSKNNSPTVYIDTISEKEYKRINVNCNDKKETYGDFYGVFNDTFSNKDIYTGTKNENLDLNVKIDSIIENTDSVHPGLYSTFKQVQDGYSIVLFGYGLSGSGKTFTLVGEKNTPGLIHYGLNNLQGVSNIKIKYIFEQYVKKFTPTLKNISGEIINLVGTVPKLQDFSISENDEFNTFTNNFNFNNINVNSFNTLTKILEDYRISKYRIKKTPNNDVSSRSHLYIVFEIQFDTKKTGYITLVDTAGRESPSEIYKEFIKSDGKTNLTSIFSDSLDGVGLIQKYLKEEYINNYSAQDIFEILKEGFYINETLNHLVYFFNKKNYKKTIVKRQSTLDKYIVNNFFVSPSDETKEISGYNNCLTIPILTFLDFLSNKKADSIDYKPTKFICIVCVRQEEKYCSQIFQSLEFAQKITSS